MYSAHQHRLTSHWRVASLQEDKIDEADMGDYQPHLGDLRQICLRAATDLGQSTAMRSLTPEDGLVK